MLLFAVTLFASHVSNNYVQDIAWIDRATEMEIDGIIFISSFRNGFTYGKRDLRGIE